MAIQITPKVTRNVADAVEPVTRNVTPITRDVTLERRVEALEREVLELRKFLAEKIAAANQRAAYMREYRKLHPKRI